MAKPQPAPAAAREHLWKLIKDVRFAMFTTRDAQGSMRSRPMTTQNAAMNEDDSLWFFASRSGQPVADFESNPMVNVSYSDPAASSYVSVSGKASVVEDMARKKQLWSKMVQAWFPGGVDDPDLALVKVAMVDVEYWDVNENKVQQLFKMAKAAVTGEPPTDLGEHADVPMR